MQLNYIKRLFSVLFGCLFFLLLSTAEAIPVFNITTPNTTLNLTPGQTATVTYVVENSSGINMPNMRYFTPPFTSRAPGSSCSNILAPFASCNLLLTVKAPNVAPGHISLGSLSVCGFNGMICSTANVGNRIQLNVVSVPTQGHFVFRDGGGADITTLDLAPNATGTVTLHNTGGTTISAVSVTIPAAISGYFSGTCTTVTSLAPGASCTLAYSIPASPNLGSYNIMATGTDADNSPHTLAVTIATLGHFVFRDGGGADITTLDLAPNATGTVTLHNTGGGTISAMSVTIPAAISTYFSGTCTTVTSLAAGASCTLSYTIPATPAAGNYDITATGTNADNSPHILAVTIATQGRFVFRDGGGADITNLDLAPSDTGTVTLHNTGGSTITSLSVTIPAAISGYFSGTCTTVTSLTPGASCTLAYSIPAAPAAGSYNIVATGTNADNSPKTLAVTIATQGRFVFRDGGGSDITTLDLAPNESGTVTLNNTGGSTISAMSVTIPAAISTYFSGTCTTVTSLAPGASCTLAYSIPAAPAAGSYNIVATGTNADNSPKTLAVTIATQGHFVFRDGGGSDITTLDLAPNESGTVTLNNTGGSTITSLSVTIPAAISGYFSGSCTTVTSLAAGASCTLAYTIPAAPNSGLYNIVATGTNADNSPHTLEINIIVGKVFINSSDDVIECDVNLLTGVFSNCIDAASGEINNLSGSKAIDLNPAGTQIFIPNRLPFFQLYRCDVSPTGVFTNCVDTGMTGLTDPTSVRINAAATILFISNHESSTSGGRVERCDLSPTGAVSNCGDTGATMVSDPSSIALNSTETRIFIVNEFNNQVIQCDLNPITGMASNCSDTGATGLSRPVSILVNTAETKAFITNAVTDIVTQCDVNQTTGALTNCADSGATVTGPLGMAFNAGQTKIFITSLDGYITQCDVNQITGALTNCTIAEGSVFGWELVFRDY